MSTGQESGAGLGAVDGFKGGHGRAETGANAESDGGEKGFADMLAALVGKALVGHGANGEARAAADGRADEGVSHAVGLTEQRDPEDLLALELDGTAGGGEVEVSVVPACERAAVGLHFGVHHLEPLAGGETFEVGPLVKGRVSGEQEEEGNQHGNLSTHNAKNSGWIVAWETAMDLERLRQRLSDLTDEAILETNPQELTEEALAVYDAELASRGLAWPGEEETVVEETTGFPKPEEDQLAPLGRYENFMEARFAYQLLKQEGIPVWIAGQHKKGQQGIDPNAPIDLVTTQEHLEAAEALLNAEISDEELARMAEEAGEVEGNER